MRRIILLFVIAGSLTIAQDTKSSFFDESPSKEYLISNILVEGEVENPGMVDLTSLPLNGFPVKNISYGKDKNRFLGAYFFSGFSLFDILKQKKIKKANEGEFRPFVDLYIIIENAKGEKAVFSWGEIFYSKDNFKVIIAKSVRAINPPNMKMKWQLPDETQLVCGNDAFNFRNIVNPTKIIIKSFAGKYSQERVKDLYTAEFEMVNLDRSFVVKEIVNVEKRNFRGIGYGHGMGWKGIENIEGFVFKDVLKSYILFDKQLIGNTILCVSAKDGYRVTFSLSEILNRNDMNDVLLIEITNSSVEGKYNLFATPDFFVDRNVRSVEKIEILTVN